jgi:hypothetical protein
MDKLNSIAFKRIYKGQYFKNLVDLTGTFYIIHPYENLLHRNICNTIIKYKNVEINKIPAYEFNKYLTILQSKLVIVDVDYNPNDIFDKDKDKTYFRTNLYGYVLELQKSLSDNTIDINDCLILFSSMGLDCFNEVLAVLTMVKVFGTSGINDKANAQKFINKWSNSSDLIMLYNIFHSLKSNFSFLKLFKIMSNPNELHTFDDSIDDLIKLFLNEMKNKPDDIPTTFKNKETEWNNLKKLYNAGNLKNTKGKKELKFETGKKEMNLELSKNNDNIKKWCYDNYLDVNFIIDFLTKLSELLLNILTIERNLDIELLEISPLIWINNVKSNFRKVLRSNTMEEKILKSFIIGKPLNYAIKVHTIDTKYNLSIGGIMGEIKNEMKSDSKSTMKSSIVPSNFIFYYEYLETRTPNTVNLKLTNSVDLDYFTSTLPNIFNKRFFKNIIYNLESNIIDNKIVTLVKSYKIYGDIYDMIINYVNNHSLHSSPWESEALPYINDYMKKLRKL